MGRIEKTVFISYRRTNMPWALAIFQNLKSEGYDVFFDYLSIPSGDFEKSILDNIRGRAHFIVILTPSALERCNELGDWLRREIECAIDEKRNIVPVMLESFDFGSPATTKALTGKLENLKKYNGLSVPSEYFFEAMERLREQFLNVALDTVVHPIPEHATQVAEEHQAAANEATQVVEEELSAQEWFERAYVFVENSNFDEAIRCYTEAIRLNPYFVMAFNNRGIAHRRKGDLDNAIADYDEAIRLKPDNVEAFHNRGVAHEVNDDLDSAVKDYNEAIRLNPDHVDSLYMRGAVRQRKGDLEAAVKDFLKATFIKPDDGGIVGALVGVLQKLGRLDEARQQEQRARKLIRKENEYNRACFEAICGNAEQALELLKTALEKKQAPKEYARLDPDFENLRDDPRFQELVGK